MYYIFTLIRKIILKKLKCYYTNEFIKLQTFVCSTNSIFVIIIINLISSFKDETIVQNKLNIISINFKSKQTYKYIFNAN